MGGDCGVNGARRQCDSACVWVVEKCGGNNEWMVNHAFFCLTPSPPLHCQTPPPKKPPWAFAFPVCDTRDIAAVQIAAAEVCTHVWMCV